MSLRSLWAAECRPSGWLFSRSAAATVSTSTSFASRCAYTSTAAGLGVGMRRRLSAHPSAVRHGTAGFSYPSSTLSPLLISVRSVFADKIRAGMILKVDKKHFRVIGSTRSQKGQNAASFNVKLVEVGSGRKKEVTAAQGHDFEEVRAERVRLLFSGFDDDDFACFVYPEHSSEAGKEINLPGASLPEQQQLFLCCGMPVDLLHILADEESNEPDRWCEVMMPNSYIYTVEQLHMKGMYKMATLKECDGTVSVNDTVQLGEPIKVVLKADGTASFGGRANG